MDSHQIPIRTIKVTPFESNMESDIEEYFAQYGEIDSVEVNSENGIQCEFVEFELVGGATAALSNKLHRISCYDVTVEAAEPWHQPDQILNALDDDCLRSIFEYLEPKDLKNTAKVCNRFKKCAEEEALVKKYKTVNLNGDDTDVLVKFGKLMRSLHIDYDKYCEMDDYPKLITLEMIIKYTIVYKLEKLSIPWIETSENLINLKEFTNLKEIELEWCTIPNLNELLNVCPKLKILKIDCFNLEKNLQFLSNLNSLKALRLIFQYNDPRDVAPLLNALAAAQSPLEEILLDGASITNDVIQNMSKLKQLNMIELNYVYELTNDHVIQLSRELPQLKQLILSGHSGRNITAATLKTMIHHSMKLSYIEISQANSLSIDSSDYFSMLEIIQNRPDQIRLSIIVIHFGDIVVLPKEIVALNRKYLLIDRIFPFDPTCTVYPPGYRI